MSDVRMLTLQERQQIEALIKESLSLTEIGRRIGRSKNAVITDVRLNGGIGHYTAEKAQRSAYERQVLGRQKLHDINVGQKSSYTTLRQRIEHLEMQVEILVDCLKQGAT